MSSQTTQIPIAQHLGGLLFQCPCCGSQNRHNPSEPGKSIAEEFGTTRMCNKCSCNYYLVYKYTPSTKKFY